jgi:hypothetical protein
MLCASGALPPRDEELARAERWLAELLATITDEQQRRLLRAFATHDLPTPEPLGKLLLQLATDGKTHVGIDTPARAQSRWLFPGGMPGRPITASRLADRLRTLGIPTQAGRRAALTDLAAHLPAAVLADLLGLHPTHHSGQLDPPSRSQLDPLRRRARPHPQVPIPR